MALYPLLSCCLLLRIAHDPVTIPLALGREGLSWLQAWCQRGDFTFVVRSVQLKSSALHLTPRVALFISPWHLKLLWSLSSNDLLDDIHCTSGSGPMRVSTGPMGTLLSPLAPLPRD